MNCKIYLFIRPEQVVSLVGERLQAPSGVCSLYQLLAKKKAKALRLRFTLAEPTSLVVPDVGGCLIPRTKGDIEVLATLQGLAQGHTLELYMPGDVLQDEQLHSLCSALSAGPDHSSNSGDVGVGGSERSRCPLRSSPEYGDPQTLYKKHRGVVVPLHKVAGIVAVESPTVSRSSAQSASPPSYDELGPSPPPVPPLSSSRKRLRTDSQGAGAGPATAANSGRGSDNPQAQQASRLMDEANLKISKLQRLVAELDEKEAHLQATLDEATHKIAHLKQACLVHPCNTTTASNVDAGQEQTQDKEEQVPLSLKQYVESELDGLRGELQQYIDERFTELDTDVVLQHEMEEYVDYRVQVAQDSLLDRMSRGVSIHVDDF